MNQRLARILFAACLWLSATCCTAADDADTGLRWRFDARSTDEVSESADRFSGNHRRVAGVQGDALVFDGYTTVLRRDAETVPDIRNGFTVAGWIAVAAYPFAPVPIVDQLSSPERGFAFELGPRGELSLRAGAGGRALHATSAEYIVPHGTWTHVAAIYDPAAGLAVYLDGERIAETPFPENNDQGGRNPDWRLEQASELDMFIGAVRNPRRPSAYHRRAGSRPSWLSLDAAIDELSVLTEVVDAKEIRALSDQYDPGPSPLKPRVMPSGPPGAGRFGAYETTLGYHPEWDALSRVGDYADIVVRFDASPARVVFWRGTQYSPAWVTGNGLWMADQSVEGYDDDYTWEHMNDKYNHYSRVRVIEESDARVVVHWRYLPVDVRGNYLKSDERDEAGAWVDEYYYFYPDVTAVREVTWRDGTLGAPIQFQESIPLAHPGQTQGDVVKAVYATVGNLAGETQSLEYVAEPAASAKEFPGDLTIQMHHLQSGDQPFIVFEPGNRMTYLRDLDERSLARPGSSSHWPVARIRSDGRTAQAPDRATSFLGFPISEPVVHRLSSGRNRINSLYGMTNRPFEELVMLARSWSTPPRAVPSSTGFDDGDFDRSQRVYRFRRTGDARELAVDIEANRSSPIHNLAVIVEDWGNADATLGVDGETLPRGNDFRYGLIHTLESSHLIAWIRHRATRPTRITLSRITRP